MSSAVRPYLTAGVALAGAGVFAVSPSTQVGAQIQTADTQVRLVAAVSSTDCVVDTAGGQCGDAMPTSTSGVAELPTLPETSILYAPINLFNAFLSIPANEVAAMDRFADAMLGTGSWQVWGPNNVFGFDQWDPPRLKAMIDMLVPFPAFSTVLGNQTAAWAQANLPMNAGCAAMPGACPDLSALLKSMFKVPMSEFYDEDGYTFGEVVNPFTGEVMPWSGTTVKFEPFEPVKAMTDSLFAKPTGPKFVSLQQTFATIAKVAKSLWLGFYPFVQNSEWYNKDQTGMAPLFKALAPLLCGNCNPDQPYDNPWLYEKYQPHTPSDAAATETAALAPAATEVTATKLDAAAPPAAPEHPKSGIADLVGTGTRGAAEVAGFLKKLDLPAEPQPETAPIAPSTSTDTGVAAESPAAPPSAADEAPSAPKVRTDKKLSGQSNSRTHRADRDAATGAPGHDDANQAGGRHRKADTEGPSGSQTGTDTAKPTKQDRAEHAGGSDASDSAN